MRKKEILIILFVFVIIALFFFHKTVFLGFVPFPGDLLIAEYNPWKTYSYLGYNPGSFPNKAQYFDVLRQLYPWKTFSISLLKNREIPLWNPHNFSGSPLLANFQSAIFYPLNFLYFVFPQLQAWSILVILQPIFLIFFTYLFARKIGISKIGSLFSSISYGFSGFMTVWLEYNTIGHVIMWLPLLLLCAENLFKKNEVKWILIFIFSLVSSLFAGHPQVFAFLFIFLAIYILYRIFTLRLSKVLILFFTVLLLLSVGMGAVQIFPGLELLRESARVSYDYSYLTQKILIQPWQFIMMIVPDFFGNPATRNYWLDDTYVGKVTYVGIIPLFFVLFSLKYFRQGLIRFFVSVGIVVWLLVSINPVSAILYKLNIPLISASAPTLSIFLFNFCISVLSGFGIDIWRKEKQNVKKVIITTLPLLIVILFLWTVVSFAPNLISDRFLQHIGTAYRNLILTTFLVVVGLSLIIVKTLNRKLICMFLIMLFVVQTADLFRFFTKFNPFVPKELVFPNASVFEFMKEKSGIDRFWGYGIANIEANFATQYSLFSPDGYDPLYPKRYGEFIQSSKDGKIKEEFTRETRSDAVIASGFGELDLSLNTNRLKVLDLLGAKYILDRVENGSTESTFPKNRFNLIYDNDGWRIYENIKALPRAFLVSDYKVFKNKEEFEKIFFDENFDPSKTVLLADTPSRSPSSLGQGFTGRVGNLEGKAHEGSPLSPRRWSGRRSSPARQAWEDSDLDSFEVENNDTVNLVSYKPNKIIINALASTDQLLFLSDAYYPGWKAFINGKTTKIYRANYAFRAIEVPKGDHKISFIFDPDSFGLGFKISLGTLVLSFSLLIFVSFRKGIRQVVI